MCLGWLFLKHDLQPEIATRLSFSGVPGPHRSPRKSLAVPTGPHEKIWRSPPVPTKNFGGPHRSPQKDLAVPTGPHEKKLVMVNEKGVTLRPPPGFPVVPPTVTRGVGFLPWVRDHPSFYPMVLPATWSKTMCRL